MKHCKLLFGCAALLTVLSCGKRKAEPMVQREIQAATPTLSTANVTEQMRKHRIAARRLINASVAGDLNTLKRVANDLSMEDWSPEIKKEWRVFQQAMQRAAEKLAASKLTVEIMVGMGQLGDACAGCHETAKRPMAEHTPYDPWSSMAVSPAMREHYRGTLLLWEGLSEPSSSKWQEGAEVLTNADWVHSDVQDVEVLLQRVEKLGAIAQSAEGAQRGKVVGELLSTCGQCHRAVGVGEQVRAYLHLTSERGFQQPTSTH